MTSLNILWSDPHNFLKEVTQNKKKENKKNNRKEARKNFFCGPSKKFKNISWPINICLNYFMAPRKTLTHPSTSSYKLNVQSLSTLFMKTNSSGLMFESIKALKSKGSMPFNLVFANITILSCFFFFFLFTDFLFLIPEVIAQSFNYITRLIIPIGISNKEAKIEIEIDPVIA